MLAGRIRRSCCLSCGAKEVMLMLKHSTRKLLIYVSQGEDYIATPVKGAPLPEEWRKKVMHALSRIVE